MTRQRLLLVSLLALLWLPACATVRGGEKFDAGSSGTRSGAPKPSVSVIVESERSWNGAISADSSLPSWSAEAVRAYQESGLFASVQTGLAPSDFEAWISLRSETAVNDGLASASIGYAGLIPFRIETYVTIELKVRDAAGNLVGSAVGKEPVHTWVHLFLLPAAPFSSKDAVSRDVVGDLIRATLLEAYRGGAFDQVAASQAP